MHTADFAQAIYDLIVGTTAINGIDIAVFIDNARPDEENITPTSYVTVNIRQFSSASLSLDGNFIVRSGSIDFTIRSPPGEGTRNADLIAGGISEIYENKIIEITGGSVRLSSSLVLPGQTSPTDKYYIKILRINFTHFDLINS